ncbi:MAG: RNA-binding transcriptional accessory protein [Acidobacteria bacterium]|nr:RNA-binding transcriptional accessory protein [Acidobacteriota bacterium]
MDSRIVSFVIAEFSHLKTWQIENTIQLLEGGDTIPFITRYRKEKTGELDEVQIQSIRDRYHYLLELEERKKTILESIDKQGKLSADLEQRIRRCERKQELEDLYLPYRPKRRTRGAIAREKGLEPLAVLIRDYIQPTANPAEICHPFIDAANEVGTIQEALQGASDILAEEIAENPDYRKFMRKIYAEKSLIVSQVKKEHEEERSKFEMYYRHSEPLAKVPSHRFLAMRRGEKEKYLTLDLQGPDDQILGVLASFWIRHPESFFSPLLRECLEDAFRRLMRPSLISELLTAQKNQADDDAILVFEKNLRNLLLQPPGGAKVVMGVDPGFRTGCKVAIVDSTGKYQTHTTVYPVEPFHKSQEAAAELLLLFKRHDVEVVSIGNGTASRETHTFFTNLLKEHDLADQIRIYVVNEAGASVYSASEVAREEFPDLDSTIRGAISIARRFQDPLSELVKIDPKSIGVGQYQHDVNQRKLKSKLSEVVQFVVNRVGVELNSASYSLLEYVSGISAGLARSLVAYRDEQGPFPSRQALRGVPRFGEKTYEQAAGFLRIRAAENPLDGSAVHPERYELVERMAADLAVKVTDLMENSQLIRQIRVDRYVSEDAGLPTLKDIIAELTRPGRDPRQGMISFEFDSNVNDINDLQEGMVLSGIVTNVTNFGAFVDIGVHQDGLVHVSKMGRDYVKNPYDVCSVGQRVSVKVIRVDLERKRISLSMQDFHPAES